MSEIRNTDMLLALGVGFVAGAVAGVLLAPASGEESRRRLGELGGRALDRSREGVEHTKDAVRSAVDDVEGALRQGAERAKAVANDQARRIGEAFQEGKEAYLREAR